MSYWPARHDVARSAYERGVSCDGFGIAHGIATVVLFGFLADRRRGQPRARPRRPPRDGSERRVRLAAARDGSVLLHDRRLARGRRVVEVLLEPTYHKAGGDVAENLEYVLHVA